MSISDTTSNMSMSLLHKSPQLRMLVSNLYAACDPWDLLAELISTQDPTILPCKTIPMKPAMDSDHQPALELDFWSSLRLDI